MAKGRRRREPTRPLREAKGTRSAADAGDARRAAGFKPAHSSSDENHHNKKKTSPCGDVGPAIRSLGGLTTMIL